MTARWILLLMLIVPVFGCTTETRFQNNLVYLAKETAKADVPTVQQQRDIQNILTGLFGTPDEPMLPPAEGADVGEVLSLRKLKMAAGRVGSDEFGRPHGLYRKHCVHCHGVTGDGLGPTAAFLNPYPRDYRRGTFKFKSTPSEDPPTHDDLKRILVNGIPGTAMPSFKLLDEDELESLVQYVKYLSIRGQVERRLISETVQELDADSRLVNLAADPTAAAVDDKFLTETVGDVIEKWANAEANQTPVPKPPENWESVESVARGRELFFTSLTNCSKCHGDLALGDGQTTDYDEWTLEWTVKIGIDPRKPADVSKLSPFYDFGALHPRNIRPRNLRQGIYRGGRRPLDVYRRVKQGIAGVPMPAASSKMSSDDIWHLVAYVMSLPYESISQPRHETKYQRDRS